MKSIDAAALVKQPEDVTENPYRKPMKEGKKEKPFPSAADGEVCVCFQHHRQDAVFLWDVNLCMKVINLHLSCQNSSALMPDADIKLFRLPT